MLAHPMTSFHASSHVCTSWPFGQGWTECWCCTPVIVLCDAIHFMIFLFSALYHRWAKPYKLHIPGSQLGSSSGRHLWETGRWKEETSQGVSSLLSASGSIFTGVDISLLWFLLPLAAPPCMVLVSAWQLASLAGSPC